MIEKTWGWLNQKVTLMLISDSKHKPIHFAFKPILPITIGLFLAIFISIGIYSFSLLGKDRLYLAQASLESQQKEEDVSRIENNLEKTVKLINNFKELLSTLREERENNFKNEKENLDNGDFLSLKESDNKALDLSSMSSTEQLNILQSSIQESILPLKETLSLISSQSRLLTELPTMWPVIKGQGHISFLFGPNLDPVTRSRWYLHRGLDIAQHPSGMPIVASADGTVIEVSYKPLGYGNSVKIKHKYGFYTLYGHMQRILTTVGTVVKQGDIIGLMGATGRATGPHVHFEIRIGSEIVDPLIYLRMSSRNKKMVDALMTRYTLPGQSGGNDGSGMGQY